MPKLSDEEKARRKAERDAKAKGPDVPVQQPPASIKPGREQLAREAKDQVAEENALDAIFQCEDGHRTKGTDLTQTVPCIRCKKTAKMIRFFTLKYLKDGRKIEVGHDVK